MSAPIMPPGDKRLRRPSSAISVLLLKPLGVRSQGAGYFGPATRKACRKPVF
jgi:hypothetical protein